SYHAGLSSRARRRIQREFSAGAIRILVATAAFGMGMDRPAVSGIVHLGFPGNFESYVQQVGRAGRDGGTARCELLLEPEGRDLPELRRHILADSVDFLTVKKLLQKVFFPCKCREILGKIRELAEVGRAFPRENQRICHRHERSIGIQETVESLDLREEAIETLLSYLDLHPGNFLELLPPTYSRCRIRCSGGRQQLREVAKSSPPLAVFLASNPAGISGSAEFDVVALSDSMGWESALVKRELRRLRRESGNGDGIQVEFHELSFHFRAVGDLSAPELDSICEFLHGRAISREKAALRQLRACFRAFRSVAFPSFHPEPPEEEEERRSSRLKEILQEYFRRDRIGSDREDEEEEEEEEKKLGMAKDWEEQIRRDIRNFLAAHPDEDFTGRAIARVFHGIGSPRFPAQIYGRDRRFWRKHLSLDFQSLSRLATEEILAWR
ncbi:RECQ4 helicase, partial [Grantiella picta]|nr:RECQ4 helicase [Grantiella picta]